MRKIIYLLLLGFLTVNIYCQKIEYRTTSNLNLRKQNNINSEIIEVLKKGDIVRVLENKDGWASVLVHGNKGFVSNAYLEKRVVLNNKIQPSIVFSFIIITIISIIFLVNLKKRKRYKVHGNVKKSSNKSSLGCSGKFLLFILLFSLSVFILSEVIDIILISIYDNYISLNETIIVVVILICINIIELRFSFILKKVLKKSYNMFSYDIDVIIEKNRYVISPSDYHRGNKIDRNYLKKYKLRLLSLYNNKCARCNSDKNGIDIDHCFIPKNRGGSFIISTKEGMKINNAVPLCESCNRSKGVKDYRVFFSKEEIERITEKNKEMTRIINS